MSFIIDPYRFGGGGGVTPISLVADMAAGSGASHSVTTGTIDTTGASLLVAAIGYYSLGSAGAGISDSKSNTWAALTAYTSQTDPSIRLYYVKNPTVGAGHTFTYASTSQYPSIAVCAFDQTDTVANADGDTGAGNGASATIQPGSITPSADNSLLVTAVAGKQTAETVDSGFTLASSSVNYSAGQHYQLRMAYLVQTSAAAVNPQWDLTTSGILSAAMSAFLHG